MPWLWQISSFGSLRVFLGFVLLVAVALKAHEMAVREGAIVAESHWLLVAASEFELAIGVWLISGICSRQSRAVAIALFGALAGISLAKAASGANDCGCFGKVPVSPWLMFVFDAVAAGSLWICSPSDAMSVARPRRHSFSLAAVLWAFLAVAVAGAAQVQVVSPGFQRGVVRRAGTTILYPNQWVAREFPLLEHVAQQGELAHGQWYVLLVRRGCAQCERVADAWDNWRRQNQTTETPGLALIEIRPPGRFDAPAMAALGAPAFITELRGLGDVYVETPTLVRLSDVGGLAAGPPAGAASAHLRPGKSARAARERAQHLAEPNGE